MWKIFPIYSFLYLFQRKWLIVEEKSYLSIFWNFQTQFYPQNHSPFFFVCLRLSKIIQNIYFARENCVFMNTSWRKFAKTIGYNYFALKMKLTLSTTHITKVKNTLNIMYNDRKVNKLSETFCFWKLLGIRFGWLIYIFVYWVIFELNQKFCDIFFTKFCNVVIRLWIILAYFNTMTQKIQRS